MGNIKSLWRKFDNACHSLAAPVFALTFVPHLVSDDPPPSPQDILYLQGQCIYAHRTDDLTTSRQQEILTVLEAGSSSKTMRYFARGAREDGTLLCSIDELKANKEDHPKEDRPKVSSVTLAHSLVGKNTIEINSDLFERDNFPIWVLPHELRHKDQDKMGFPVSGRANLKPKYDLALTWVKEADSRLVSIVSAYELAQRGDSSQINLLRSDSWHAKLIKAFEESLEKDPDDMATAMRAVIYAFRAEKDLSCNYDNRKLAYLEEISYQFDPNKPEDKPFTRESLLALGQIGDYPNYMDWDLMQYLWKSVSDEDVQALLEKRAKSANGTYEEVCLQKEERVAQGPYVPAAEFLKPYLPPSYQM